MRNIFFIVIIMVLFNFTNCCQNIVNANLTEFKVEFEYWEACETGQGDCHPLIFERNSKQDSIILVMPCGGTSTSINLTKVGEEKPLKTLNIQHDDCPPAIDLTGFEDGEYEAYMWACNLGGSIKFLLKTNHMKKKYICAPIIA